MTIQEQINILKANYQNGIIQKTEFQTKLSLAQESQAAIIKQCTDKGFKPEDLPAELNRLQNEIVEKIAKANELLPAAPTNQ